MLRFFNKGQDLALGDEIATEALKTSPPFVAAAVTLDKVLLWAGLAWIVIQAAVFLHKYIVWLKRGKPMPGWRTPKDEDAT